MTAPAFTPGEWVAEDTGNGFQVVTYATAGGTDQIAKIVTGRREYSENAANARRIVQCVNAHDELVEALRGMLDTFGLNADGFPFEDGEVPALDKARAALAKAVRP